MIKLNRPEYRALASASRVSLAYKLRVSMTMHIPAHNSGQCCRTAHEQPSIYWLALQTVDWLQFPTTYLHTAHLDHSLLEGNCTGLISYFRTIFSASPWIEHDLSQMLEFLKIIFVIVTKIPASTFHRSICMDLSRLEVSSAL